MLVYKHEYINKIQGVLEELCFSPEIFNSILWIPWDMDMGYHMFSESGQSQLQSQNASVAADNVVQRGAEAHCEKNTVFLEHPVVYINRIVLLFP